MTQESSMAAGAPAPLDFVFAPDTTGLPGRSSAGWEARIVGLGAAFVRGTEIIGSTGSLVLQAKAHVDHPAAKKALEINGLRWEDIAAGSPETLLAEQIKRQTRSDSTFWGYPISFTQHFLARGPWFLIDGWGPCLMESAIRGVYRGEVKAPKRLALNVALGWAMDKGHDVEAPFSGQRCESQAIRIAKLLVALRKEGILPMVQPTTTASFG